MTAIRQLKSNHIYFAGLLLLVASLPLSLFLTSISEFVLAISFLVEGSVREKIKRFLSNKTALLFAGIWFLHLLGMFWTSDVNEGLKDLKIKLPLLLLPLIIGGSRPLSPSRFRWVLMAFIASVFCGSLISIAVLTGIIHRNIYDIRDIFIFNISHIRFALFTCFSVYLLIWIAFREGKNMTLSKKIIAVFLISWLISFLIIVESVTGLIIFSITGLILLLYQALSGKNFKFKIALIVLVLLIPLSFILVLEKFVDDFYKNHPYPINISEKTLLGNEYQFNLEDPLYENGYPVWVYICEGELRTEWNRRSELSYDSLDERKQPLQYTLIRFLSSKGLRKDAEGVRKLSQDEIRAVERGVANVNYQDISSIEGRLLQIMWEFDQFIKGGNPSGHSVTQRFEFWKAATSIASENILTGVGTGDMPLAFHIQYEKMHSTLDEKHRLRAHNQFLAVLVAFGVFGLIYFVAALFYPFLVYKRRIGFLFVTFFLIGFLSMFTEDTLETQAGATFIAFFFTFLLFARSVNSIEK